MADGKTGFSLLEWDFTNKQGNEEARVSDPCGNGIELEIPL